MIWIGIIMYMLISTLYTLNPIYPTWLLKPDIVIPPGFLIEPDHGFYDSFVFYAEKPDFEKLIQNTDPSYPDVLNEYLEKREKLENLYEQKTDKLIKHYDLFPVTSDGNQRICVVGSSRSDEHSKRTVYLMDNQFNVLDQAEIYGNHFQYFVSARFRDRLWIQTGDGGNGGYLIFYEIKFSGDHLLKIFVGEGSEGEYKIFKLNDPANDPKIILYHKPFTIFYIITLIIFPSMLKYYFEEFYKYYLPNHWLNLSIIILSCVIFLLLWLFARKQIKAHLTYIRTTFLSLFRQHPHD